MSIDMFGCPVSALDELTDEGGVVTIPSSLAAGLVGELPQREYPVKDRLTEVSGAPVIERTPEELRRRDELIGAIVRPGDQLYPNAHERMCPSPSEIVRAVHEHDPSFSIQARQAYAEALIKERANREATYGGNKCIGLTRWELPCRLDSDIAYARCGHSLNSYTSAAEILRRDRLASQGNGSR